MPGDDALLEVRNLRVGFGTAHGRVTAVDGVSFAVRPGSAVAIVGESGSGKSVTVRALLGLLPPNGYLAGGSAVFAGRDLLSMPARELRRVRGNRIGMVFQNAMEAMNPTVPLRGQLTEHLRWHRLCDRAEAVRRATRALADMGIPEPERRLRMYPFQLSGGMRQRAMIAMAVVTEPALLIADEPTTAVDVTLQRQILDLLSGLKRRGMAIIMITHDLGVARYFCDEVVVMYAGRVMERAQMEQFLADPRHPYSRGLLDSTIEVGDRHRELRPIDGSPPDLADRPPGCPFHPRCDLVEQPRCGEDQTLAPVAPDRLAACWKAHNAAA